MEAISLKNPFSNAKVIGSGIAAEVYRRNTEKRGSKEFPMSRGHLMEFNRCPHRWLMGYESDETKASEWGTLIDALVLSPDAFESDFAITPETYTNDKGEEKPWNWNANACKSWRDQRDGQTVVKSDVFAKASNAVRVLMADQQVAALVACSEKQVMVIAEYFDEETRLNIPVKGLIDLVPQPKSAFGKALADLKTCNTASPFPWTRAVFEHGYHVQAAFYLDMYVTATGEDRIEFLHVLQESYAPWEVGKRILSEEFIQLGRLQYLTALKRYCRCLVDNHWPGYDDEGRMILNGWNLTSPEAWMIGKE
jgi:hypothetical protein